MACPRTRMRSKTPDPAWASPPPGRALKKAHNELTKQKVSVKSCATPQQRRLTFNEVAIVTQIEAENQAPVKPGDAARPAMSVADADKILEKVTRLVWCKSYMHTEVKVQAVTGAESSDSESQAGMPEVLCACDRCVEEKTQRARHQKHQMHRMLNRPQLQQRSPRAS